MRILQLHRDDRGNLGILLLLTLWALVAMIGIVWNSGEYATRKRHLQNAVDSAAHAGNMWVSRTTNLTASTNLLMSENGSAEVILRSVPPTHSTIQSRFDAERKRAHLLREGNRMNDPEKSIPDCEYFEELLGFGAWSGKGRGDGLAKELSALAPDVLTALKIVLPHLNAAQAAKLSQEVPEHLRRNNVAMQWLNGQYIPKARSQVQPWIEQQVRPRLDDIIATLDREQSWLDRWVDQTNPAVNGTTPQQLRQNRAEIFDYQQQIRDLTPQVVDEQRSAMASFYKCDVTISTPGHASSGGPAPVDAPVSPSETPEKHTLSDSIRERYSDAARLRFDDVPMVNVDPVNVNVPLNGNPRDDAVIWHPGVGVDAPPGVVLAGQEFSGHFHVPGGEWGKIPCAPLLRYFDDRLSRDKQGLRLEPQKIDGVRDDLRSRIHPPPAAPGIAGLPRTIPDTDAKSSPIPLPPESIPKLPVPRELSAAEHAFVTSVNARIEHFNTEFRKFISELRGLGDSLDRMYKNLNNLTDHASERFADATWLGFVEDNRWLVLLEMGDDKTFMVLRTYELRDIPDWARSGMHDSAHDYVYKEVRSRGTRALREALRSRLEQWAYNVLNGSYSHGGKGSGQAARQARKEAKQFANQVAPSMAEQMAEQAAEQIAREVSQEWIHRPWPFEIDTPTEEVPPSKGLTDEQRQHYFTFLAAGKTGSDSTPKPFFSKIFGEGATLTAFAQAENFNWMEFHERYGAGERFDQVTHYGHGLVGGSPAPWRISTIGGWTWQPRLALSDALGEAIEDGDDFREFLQAGGVTSYNADAIKTLTTH